MRMGPEKGGVSSPSDGVWFAAAIVLGAIWGFSVQPLYLPPEIVGGTGLIFYGWLLVGVLCLCLALMGRMLLHAAPEVAYQAMVLKQGPLTVMAMPTPRSTPGPDVQTRPEVRSAPTQPAPDAQAPRTEPPAASEKPTSTENPSPPPVEKPLSPGDPFLAALDYLGHAQATVRIGGILALERLVRQGGDLQSCVGTLAAYIQQWADMESTRKRPGFDVGAALAVLTRLLPSGDATRNFADLRHVNLAGLELTDADMSHFHFEHADLSGADLRGVNFSGVNFRGASLRGAQLAGAIFPGASFRGADLTGALLSDDEFGAADLSMAGNISAAQLLHVRYLPGRPPRLPAGMALPHQNSAMAV